ncbi:hypothetical protein EDB80DRAFT_812758 [Ilyonectria destructans]|nr:hypothetical protein EDB80DRAFT_812758 [Ilyonectria destructans]
MGKRKRRGGVSIALDVERAATRWRRLGEAELSAGEMLHRGMIGTRGHGFEAMIARDGCRLVDLALLGCGVMGWLEAADGRLKQVICFRHDSSCFWTWVCVGRDDCVGRIVVKVAIGINNSLPSNLVNSPHVLTPAPRQPQRRLSHHRQGSCSVSTHAGPSVAPCVV